MLVARFKGTGTYSWVLQSITNSKPFFTISVAIKINEYN